MKLWNKDQLIRKWKYCHASNMGEKPKNYQAA